MHRAIEYIEKKRDTYIAIADQIWSYAEVKNEEYRSSALLKKTLKEEGFTVTENIAGLDTAFIAEYGQRKPVIAYLGEYDALPGLSQEACCTYRKPITEDGAGHGCAHHALGTGAMAAAMATKDYMLAHNLTGTVRYYGCPAEEGGKGKQCMANAGAFNDVDAAITWHSTDDNNIWSMNFLATKGGVFHFKGITAAAPGQSVIGRSALEAVELMNIGANYLRGHLEPNCFINYAILNAGGIAPNVIPAEASVTYLLRAKTKKTVSETFKRLVEVAKGAAMMSGTSLEYESSFGTSELIPNRTLEKILYEKFLQVGPVPFTQEDLEFAREIRKTLPPGAEQMTFSALKMLYGPVADTLIPQIQGKDINDIIYPFTPIEVAKFGSTDVCDVSWFTPVAQVTAVCFAKDTPGHCWQVTTQGKTNLCHNGMLTAAKVMALSGIELFENPEALLHVREEFEMKIEGKEYTANFES
jgi:aminobenzoyl-glutamate utilization protein B